MNGREFEIGPNAKGLLDLSSPSSMCLLLFNAKLGDDQEMDLVLFPLLIIHTDQEYVRLGKMRKMRKRRC